LWLLLGGREAALRTWGVLAAGLIGGVLGLLALSAVTRSGFPPNPLEGFLSLAVVVGPYAAAAGFLAALVWPEWWWRWGLILSWGFVVASTAPPQMAAGRLAPLLLISLPCLGAGAGALLRARVPLADR